MIGLHLHVKQFEALCAEMLDEVMEADFGSIGAAAVRAVEHRLAEESAAEREAVEPADELTVTIGSDAVGVSDLVHLGVGRIDVGIDPCVAIAMTRSGTGGDDFIEVYVKLDIEYLVANGFAK